MKELDQRTLSERNEIFETLKQLISNAKSDIQVASAWFTDPELFQLLLERQKAGVCVSVIISDQKDNEKLPFNKLSRAGGSVVKIKSTGYGVMHQKFCVVDSEIAVHGSYNWTVNARKNNHESVIITNHQNTVKEMKDLFNKLQGDQGVSKVEKNEGILSRIKNFFTPKNNKSTLANVKDEEMDADPLPELKVVSNENDFTKLLDAILDAEVETPDRGQLRDKGKQIGQMTGGNPMVVPNSLETLYAELQEDESLSLEKLKYLSTKIELQRKKILAKIERLKMLESNSNDVLAAAKLSRALDQLDDLKTAIEEKERSIAFKTEEKNGLNAKITALTEKVRSLKKEFVESKPSKMRLYVFGALGVIALVSAFIFYSSASYILLFSEKDAMDMILSSQLPDMPDVFDHLAIWKAYTTKGVTAVLMLLPLFAVLTILAMLKVFTKKEQDKFGWIKNIGVFIFILILDAFVAAKVSESIHTVKYMIGQVETEFELTSIIYDWNFYKVFLLGAGVLFGLQIAAGYVKSYFDELKEDKGQIKYDKEKEYLESERVELERELKEIQADQEKLEVELIHQNGELKNLERVIHEINTNKELRSNYIEREYELKAQEVDSYADILIAKLETGVIPSNILEDKLTERVALFMEGWSQFLHEHFAPNVASEKLKDAQGLKNEWLKTKLKGGSGETFAA